MASVDLVGVEKRFGSFTALQRLNLTVADGEFLVLLGPSGCGKTTTMRMVRGWRSLRLVTYSSPAIRSPTSSRRIATSPWCSRTTVSTHI
jgi:ABC-type proline/glycine betaine transport system ATPase subunit